MELNPTDSIGSNARGTRTTTLGRDLAAGQKLQHVVPPGTWFGAAPCEGTEYALVGCTVAPGELFSLLGPEKGLPLLEDKAGVQVSNSSGECEAILNVRYNADSTAPRCTLCWPPFAQALNSARLRWGTRARCFPSSQMQRPGSKSSWLTRGVPPGLCSCEEVPSLDTCTWPSF